MGAPLVSVCIATKHPESLSVTHQIWIWLHKILKFSTWVYPYSSLMINFLLPWEVNFWGHSFSMLFHQSELRSVSSGFPTQPEGSCVWYDKTRHFRGYTSVQWSMHSLWVMSNSNHPCIFQNYVRYNTLNGLHNIMLRHMDRNRTKYI